MDTHSRPATGYKVVEGGALTHLSFPGGFICLKDRVVATNHHQVITGFLAGDFPTEGLMVFEIEWIINGFLFAAVQDFIMEVGGEGAAGISGLSDGLTLFNVLPAFNEHPT